MNLRNLIVKISPLVMSAMILISAAKPVDAQDKEAPVNQKENLSKELSVQETPMESVAMTDEYEPLVDQINIELKADDLCNQYLENMIRAQKKLAPHIGTQSYKSEVRKELPGAPIGQHCMYGQYKQLTRALNTMGDTLEIIPTAQNAQNACIAFKNSMRKKYSTSEYAGCIIEGKMYASKASYDAAFEQFVSRQKKTSHNPDSVRRVLAQEFSKKNFSIETVNPGTIMIVPRYRGSTRLFHAIMYPGIGIKNNDGNFVPRPDGIPMFVAHNREILGSLFETWDTSNVFTADIKKIAMAEYAKELERIKEMNRDELISFLKSDSENLMYNLQSLPREILINLARAKYFGHDLFENNKQDMLAMNVFNHHFRMNMMQKTY